MGTSHLYGGYILNWFSSELSAKLYGAWGWTPCRPTPSQGVPWFQERGLWQDNSYEPRPGDIIFFDWNDGGQDGQSDHVGIVEKVENGRVYTVEGNSGDSVRQNSYPIGYYEIYGYGTPAY